MDGIIKQKAKGGVYSILRKTYQVLSQFSPSSCHSAPYWTGTIAFCSEASTGSLIVRFQSRAHSVHVYNPTLII